MQKNQTFFIVFFSVLLITIVCLIIPIFVSTQCNLIESESTQEIISTCTTLSKAGFGSIIGLLGGKSIR